MNDRIYRLCRSWPGNMRVSFGVRFCMQKVPESSHDIFKVWHLRREVCEFCVKYTMQMREPHIAPYDDHLAVYRLFN